MKFIIKSIILAIIVILSITLINNIYENTVLEKSFHIRAEKDLEKIDNINYAFLGSSNVRDAINPEYVDGSFNFATGGESYFKTYHKLKNNLENKKINNIVLQMDYHTFSSIFNEDDLMYQDIWYYRNKIPLSLISKETNKGIIQVFLLSYYPVIGKASDFTVLFQEEKNNTYFGHVKQEGTLTKQERLEISEVQYNKYFEDKELTDNLTIKYVKKIFELAEAEDINVILIRYPITKEYFDKIQKDFDFDTYNKAVLEFSDENFILLDFTNIYFNNPELFYDADHLNEEGAITFSTFLNEQLKEFNRYSFIDDFYSNKHNLFKIHSQSQLSRGVY